VDALTGGTTGDGLTLLYRRPGNAVRRPGQRSLLNSAKQKRRAPALSVYCRQHAHTFLFAIWNSRSIYFKASKKTLNSTSTAHKKDLIISAVSTLARTISDNLITPDNVQVPDGGTGPWPVGEAVWDLHEAAAAHVE
jgi:hypothetical protein